MAGTIGERVSPSAPHKNYSRAPRSPSPLQSHHHHHHSHQSKRDKRRNLLSDKLRDMADHFTANSQNNFYAQLSALQCDINLILNADPYRNAPLDDLPNDIASQVAATREEVCSARPIATEAENTFYALAGQTYAKFVEEINGAVEEKDRDLTAMHKKYSDAFSNLHREHGYKLQLANEEHALLARTLRDRLILNLNNRKTRLTKEKEQLDIADSNALLLNPTQFSMGNATGIGSPSGGVLARKTRNTRLRPGEPGEDGVGAAETSGKRKRKAATAFDDNDSGSPGPSGRMPTNENLLARINGEAPATSHPAPSDQRKSQYYAQFESPMYTVERLFSEKELAMNMQRAHFATQDLFNKFKAQGLDAGLHAATNAAAGVNEIDTKSAAGRKESAGHGDNNGNSATDSPSAPATAHVTRSTRLTVANSSAANGGSSNPLNELANTATSAAAASNLLTPNPNGIPQILPSYLPVAVPLRTYTSSAFSKAPNGTASSASGPNASNTDGPSASTSGRQHLGSLAMAPTASNAGYTSRAGNVANNPLLAPSPPGATENEAASDLAVIRHIREGKGMDDESVREAWGRSVDDVNGVVSSGRDVSNAHNGPFSEAPARALDAARASLAEGGVSMSRSASGRGAVGMSRQGSARGAAARSKENVREQDGA